MTTEARMLHRCSLVIALAGLVVACASSTRPSFDEDVKRVEPAPSASTPAPAPSGGFASDAGAPEPKGPSDCKPCKVTGPGTYCGIDVAISPYTTGGPFGGFQSETGTGYQKTITISLSHPIEWVSVRILDPDYPNNFIRVFDENDQLRGEIPFDSDGQPNSLTDSTKGLGGNGLIRRLELVPDPQDYVAYDDLTVIPAGCDAPDVK